MSSAVHIRPVVEVEARYGRIVAGPVAKQSTLVSQDWSMLDRSRGGSFNVQLLPTVIGQGHEFVSVHAIGD